MFVEIRIRVQREKQGQICCNSGSTHDLLLDRSYRWVNSNFKFRWVAEIHIASWWGQKGNGNVETLQPCMAMPALPPSLCCCVVIPARPHLWMCSHHQHVIRFTYTLHWQFPPSFPSQHGRWSSCTKGRRSCGRKPCYGLQHFKSASRSRKPCGSNTICASS